MANDYLISKWRNWFGFFDHNGKGKLCYADMEAARRKFTSLQHLEGVEKRKAFDAFTKWWDEYVMWGMQEITVDEFIEKQNSAFKANKEDFATRMRNCQETLNDLNGVTEKGFISEEDILIFYKALGQDDEDKNKKFIQEYYPKGHKLPVSEMVELWTYYLTSEDSSLLDPCQKAMTDVGP